MSEQPERPSGAHRAANTRFRDVELASLTGLPEGLAAEILMPRLLIQRIMDLADQAAPR